MFTNHPKQETNIGQHTSMSLLTISLQKDVISMDYYTSQTTEFIQAKRYQKLKRKTVQFLIFLISQNMLTNPYSDYLNSKFKNRTIVRKTIQ